MKYPNQKDMIVIKRLLVTGLVFASGVGIGIAGNYLDQPELYGPFVCDTCTLRSPAPDAATRAFIDYMDNWLADGPSYKRMVSDRFLVCNATHCGVYTRTASGDYLGQPPMPQNPGTGGGGGGGGGLPGGGGGGGGDIFDDCVASTKPITACTSVDGGKSVCTTHSVPVLDCPP